MARQLDQILVIDIESTCWEGLPPAGQASEIIEIGICPIDVPSGQVLGKQSIMVRPSRSTVSAFCTRLTTLTQEHVEGGMSFREACAVLKGSYSSSERVWASYGDYDRRQFERQCRSQGVAYPFGPTHLNIKSLFAVIHRLPTEVGMDEALRLCHLTLEGVHHRAGDDAANIARILSRILSACRR